MKSLKVIFFISILIIAPVQASTILIIGDSLSAGYGINPEKGWVHLLSLKNKNHQIINVSTSGDTTSNGLAKLTPALEKYKPDVVIIELGANDGLRGLSIAQMKSNLETMIKQSQATGAQVLLLATYLPPNYGPKYIEQFKQAYHELEQTYQITLVPMFLEGVAGNTKFMQADGLHPNEQAQPLILETILPYLDKIKRLK
ncbi:MAG: arylesterase [Legionella sp.]|nr:arylesterase [Legionella sp.]